MLTKIYACEVCGWEGSQRERCPDCGGWVLEQDYEADIDDKPSCASFVELVTGEKLDNAQRDLLNNA